MSNKLKVAKLPSVTNFKKSIDKTNRLISSIIGNIAATEAFLDIISKSDKSVLDHPIPKSLKLEKEDEEYIYELGFIALFANYEAFAHQLIKELLRKYPKCLTGSDKTIKVGEIFSTGSVRIIKEHIIDNIAIEKSAQIEVWSKYLEDRFNIKAMPSKKFYERLCILNELRNIFVHSGGFTTTIFITKMKKYFKADILLNQRVGFERKKYFRILYSLLSELHSNISKQ